MSLIPPSPTSGPQGAPSPQPISGRPTDAFAAMIRDFSVAASATAQPHTITQSSAFEALGRIKTVHYAELKELFDHRTEPEAQKKLAALSVPYLSLCFNRLEEALIGVRNTTHVEPFLQLADSEELALLREVVSYLEKQDISTLKSDWNAVYGVSDSWVKRLIKWQTVFPEEDFKELLSETKTLLEKVEGVAEKAKRIDRDAVEALSDTVAMHTGSLEFVNMQRHAAEKGDLSSLSVAHFSALLKVTDKLHQATMKVVSNKDNELICDAAKKGYLSDIGIALSDARENQQELLSFLHDIQRAGIPPEAAAGVQNAIKKMISDIQKIYDDIHQMRLRMVGGEANSWSVDLLHQDDAILRSTKTARGVTCDNERSVSYDHGEFIEGISYELRQFRTELERLESQFGAQVPAGTQGPALSKKSIFDAVGDKIPASLETRHKNLHHKPYEMSPVTKEILYRLFAFLQLSDKAIQTDAMYEQMAKAASQAPLAKVQETKKSEQQEPVVPGSESIIPTPEKAPLVKKADNATLSVPDLAKAAPSLAEYGNKHRRLVELHDLVSAIGIRGVEVPMPYGIKSSDMHDFIGKAAPSVIEDWKKLGALYATRPEGQEGKSFLDRKDVSDLIKKVQQDITGAFVTAAQNPEFTKSLGFGGDLDEWLTAIKERGSYLMVRSTGDEDSSYANAGGNISEAYVPTTTEDILKAAGKVVASYFSIPSLANRLNARANPFENELKLAVTMQELIGESPDGTSKEIPVSLVLFTNEPNYGGNERFRIMRLSATHGHGEAVVGNKGVATDSFFLLQSRADPDDIYIVSDIKEKPHRLAPVRGEDGKVRLEKRENADPATPAFDKDMLMRLFELGKQVEARYDGQPTDMEIVVKGKTIYPVQARPVNRPVPKPSYVDPSKVAALEKSPVEQEFRGNTQVAGTADAVVIRKADEILVTTTLEDAEKNFHLGQHKLVVIKEPEPADSHFVVNFAGIGIPCIQMDNIEPVQQAIGRLGEGRSMVADIQDASIKVWNNQAASPESCISQGYLTHPAHVTISLDTTNLPRLREGSALKDLQEIIRQVKIASTQKLAHETIEAYCARPELAQLGVESARLLQEMERLQIPSLRGRVAVKAATELDAKIRRACSEAIPETTERLETLFHAKVLETLTFQPPAADGSLGKLSVVTATELLRETEQIVEYAKTLGRQARFADLVVDAQEVPLEATKERWARVLQTLETADASLQPKVDTLLQLVDILRASNSLGTWLTLVLGPTFAESGKPIHTLNALLSGIDTQLLDTMQKMQEGTAALRQMRQELPNFAEPEVLQWQLAAPSGIGCVL